MKILDGPKDPLEDLDVSVHLSYWAHNKADFIHETSGTLCVPSLPLCHRKD